MHAVRGSRRRRVGAGMHQVLSDGLPALRQQGGYEVPRRGASEAASRSFQPSEGRCVRPARRRWHGGALRAARCDAAGALWRVAERSSRALVREAVEGSAEVAWQCGHGRRANWIVRSLFAIWSEVARRRIRDQARGRTAVSTREQILPHGRILRYQFHERLTHWVAAFSYLYCLATGLAFWSPWLFWLAIVLGGGQISRILHPWSGLIFIGAVLCMYAMWASQMHMTETDKQGWT